MIEDHGFLLARARMADLRHEAETARAVRRYRRPIAVRDELRSAYARLWWAARPRAATWAPRLLEH